MKANRKQTAVNLTTSQSGTHLVNGSSSFQLQSQGKIGDCEQSENVHVC